MVYKEIISTVLFIFIVLSVYTINKYILAFYLNRVSSFNDKWLIIEAMNGKIKNQKLKKRAKFATQKLKINEILQYKA